MAIESKCFIKINDLGVILLGKEILYAIMHTIFILSLVFFKLLIVSVAFFLGHPVYLLKHNPNHHHKTNVVHFSNNRFYWSIKHSSLYSTYFPWYIQYGHVLLWAFMKWNPQTKLPKYFFFSQSCLFSSINEYFSTALYKHRNTVRGLMGSQKNIANSIWQCVCL